MSNRALVAPQSGRHGYRHPNGHAAAVQSAPVFAEEEQDRYRLSLAADLLKIRAEVAPADADIVGLASQALTAAEVIYPELPPESEVSEAE